MAHLVHKLIDNYRDIMENKSDPRVKDWPLMSSPLPTFIICLSFVCIVKVAGPKFMENRKPFELKKTLIIYNLVQVIFSTWLFYECIQSGWFTFYSFRCQPVDYSTSPIAMRMARGCWWYYISKFTEFLDTIFFVLRKKNDHVSTLHVTHHAYADERLVRSQVYSWRPQHFFGLLNTFVHIIMYSYYMFSAMGPQFQKYLWWKKYLTALQMIQFVLVMIHAFQLLFIECNYPQAFVWWIGLHAIMFYFLFADFYKQAYKKKSKAQEIGESKRASDKVNGHVKETKVQQLQSKPSQIKANSDGNPFLKPFFAGFTNICQMDHSLLYEEHEDEKEQTQNHDDAVRRRTNGYVQQNNVH